MFLLLQDQRTPVRLRNGLVTLHAYSITGLARVSRLIVVFSLFSDKLGENRHYFSYVSPNVKLAVFTIIYLFHFPIS